MDSILRRQVGRAVGGLDLPSDERVIRGCNDPGRRLDEASALDSPGHVPGSASRPTNRQTYLVLEFRRDAVIAACVVEAVTRADGVCADVGDVDSDKRATALDELAVDHDRFHVATVG